MFKYKTHRLENQRFSQAIYLNCNVKIAKQTNKMR